jgi:hypothetical protein
LARDTLVIGRLFQQRSAEIVDWVLANTSPDDRILADAAGGIYLKTGRRTSIAVPEEPFTDTRAFVQPGRYVAERLLADSVSVVVLWRSKSASVGAPPRLRRGALPGNVQATPADHVDD